MAYMQLNVHRWGLEYIGTELKDLKHTNAGIEQN